MPGMPIMPPMRANMPLPRPICFIMSAIWRCILRSLLTSSTRVPEPAAMRFLRLALRTSGFFRSAARHRRDDRRPDGVKTESSMPSASICFFTLPMPGSMPITPDMPPIFCIWLQAARRGRRGRTRPCACARRPWPPSRRRCSAAAFSTRPTMSPMPRMRPAMRVRIEILQRVELLADADQLDRLAGDGAHGQRRAAAPVAVDAGQHDAGDADRAR